MSKQVTLEFHVRKRERSTLTTSRGAILVAMRSSCLDWKSGDIRPLERIRALQQLRDRLSLSVDDMNDNPHASFADHESRGVFGGFHVTERRGYWVVSWQC
jgi:hypothetical protein